MQIFFVVLFIFALSYQPVFADQWFDRIPKSGEYKPLPEPGTELTPKDFQSINENLDKVNEEDVSNETETDGQSGTESQTVEDGKQPDQKSFGAFSYSFLIVFIIILLALGAYFWWTRKSKKLENQEDDQKF